MQRVCFCFDFAVLLMNHQDHLNQIAFSISNQKAYISSFSTSIAHGRFNFYFIPVSILCFEIGDVYTLLWNWWWIIFFMFFKKLSFYKFLEQFVFLFLSIKQSLENIGAGIYINIVLFFALTGRYLWVEDVFIFSFFSFLHQLLATYEWKMFLCLLYYTLPFWVLAIVTILVL